MGLMMLISADIFILYLNLIVIMKFFIYPYYSKHFYCYNPGQIKAELITWSSITIGKLPPHHMIHFNPLCVMDHKINLPIHRLDVLTPESLIR